MLVKHPKSGKKWLRTSLVGLAVVEGIVFAGSYLGWYNVNANRDTRKYLRDNYPSLLEWYYKTGEFIDPTCSVRKIDQAYWNAE